MKLKWIIFILCLPSTLIFARTTNSLTNIDYNKNYSWIWGGFNLILPTQNIINSPMFGGEVGWASSFGKMNNAQMFYGALIGDFVSDHKKISSSVMNYSGVDMSYVVGYERFFWFYFLPKAKRNFSFFFELGPGIGYRSSQSKPVDCKMCSSDGFAFNGVGNTGINVTFNPQDRISALIRIAGRFQVGTRISGRDLYCTKSINLNPPLFFVPTVAFALRWR